jgi:hypothetical protein
MKRYGRGTNGLSGFRVGPMTLVLLVGLSTSRVHGEPPFYVPDEDLVRAPTIVIARWDGSPLVRHDWLVNGMFKVAECKTEIVVTRVIKGSLQPGKHTVLIGTFIDQSDGHNSVEANVADGDTADLKGENLWFLESRRDWDESDRSIYPALDTFRGVQPLALLPYYRALALPHAEDEVAKLLDSPDAIVVNRTLRYLAGGILPWPHDPTHKVECPKTFRKPMIGYAAKIGRLLDRKEIEVRRTAASVYAAMLDRESIPLMRKLLSDSDAEIRTIAAWNLVRLHDEVSLGRISAAFQGNERADLLCYIIDMLGEWKSEAAVPALIAFLNVDGNAYPHKAFSGDGPIGDHTLLPAVRARLTLHALTGLWFPQDVQASLSAWEKVKALADRKEREKQWKAMVPGVACPFQAKLEGDPNHRQIVVTNVTHQPMTLAEHPDAIDHFASACNMTRFGDESRFVTLKPGESVRFDSICHCDGCWAQSHRLLIGYWNTGRKKGANAWVGAVEVSCKSIYKVPNGKIEQVVEKWPDNTLRTTGQTRDGVKTGAWTDYDLKGKPIFTFDYSKLNDGSGCVLQLFDEHEKEHKHEAEMSPIMPSK